MGRYLIVGVLVIFSAFRAFSQEILSFSHTYNNLYLINPAAAGAEGRGVGFLTYHKSWQSIEGAPQTASLSFNTITKGKKVSLGFNVYNDRRSILSSSGLLLTVGYGINFSEVSSLRFGLSGGASFNSFDLNKMVVYDEDDASLIDKLNNSIAPDGNAGVFLKLNGFHAGFTMPKLFSAPILTGDNVAKVELQQFNNLLFNVGWKMNVVPKVISFHPIVNYKMYEGTKGQYDVTGIIDFHDAFWVGGNYKEDYGYGLIAGIKLKRISIAYSYEMPTPDIYKYSGASHEVQLGVYFGKKNEKKKTTVAAKAPVKKVASPAAKPVVPKPTTTAATKPVAQTQTTKPVAPTQTTKPVTPTQTTKPVAPVRAPAKVDTIQPTTKPVVPAQTSKTGESTPTPAKTEAPIQAQTKPVAKATTPVKSEAKPVVETKRAEVIVIQKPKPQPVPIKKDSISKPLGGEKPETVRLPAATAPKSTVTIKKDTINKTVTYETATKTIEISASEKLVFAAKGTHALELQEGNYVIVGAFSVFENATKFKNQVTDMGYPAQVGFNSEKNLYYVYIFSNQDVAYAIDKKNDLRKIEEFSNAWLFIVE